ELQAENQSLHRALRQKNIIISGLSGQKGEKVETTIDSLKQKLQNQGIDLSTENNNCVYRMAKLIPNASPLDQRPLMVKLTTELKAKELLRKHKDLSKEGLRIREDLTRTESSNQYALRQLFKDARSKGSHPKWIGKRIKIGESVFSAVNGTIINTHVLKLKEVIEETTVLYPGEPVFIVGDSNTRTGQLNYFPDLNCTNVCKTRYSIDKTINNRGSLMFQHLSDLDFILLNARCRGDMPAQFTFLGHNGSSVIDLFWTNSAGLFHVLDMSALNITISPHLPICLNLLGITTDPRVAPGLKQTAFKWNGVSDIHFNTLINNLGNIVVTDDIEKQSVAIVEAVKIAARKGGMEKSVSKGGNNLRDKPWFDNVDYLARMWFLSSSSSVE
ncbi:unnamed protein product, partial [Allacma fusca]